MRKNKSSPRRDPARLLTRVVRIFYFSAFLLLALKDYAWQGFLLAVAVPTMIWLGTNFLPRLFPAILPASITMSTAKPTTTRVSQTDRWSMEQSTAIMETMELNRFGRDCASI